MENIKFQYKLVFFLFLATMLALLFFFRSRVKESQKETQEKSNKPRNELMNGDLIFHTSKSRQSNAIQLATKSKYSHCGILYNNKGKWWVFEAVQPVKLTPLDQWIARGQGGHYVLKRLKNAEDILTENVLHKMKLEGEKFIGRDYDLTFEWSDDKMYCSELIWKLYKRTTGIELGNLGKLRDFDLSSDSVREKMKERYGTNIPFNELVISPSNIFESDALTTVKSN